jgi:uncharacterized protein (DUF302 family)
MKKILLGCLFLVLALPVYANELMMVKIYQDFPETMSSLQAVIKKHGYQVSRVQRVDVGLEAMGYKTDRYRIVFFGKLDEINAITSKYPNMFAYLPLSIALIAENGTTNLASVNPEIYFEDVEDVQSKVLLTNWSKDIALIFEDVIKESSE